MKGAKNMNKIKSTIAVIIVAAMAILPSACGVKPVATVNDQKVTQEQLNRKIEQLKAYATQQGASLEGEQGKALLASVERQALDDIEQELIIMSDATSQKVEVSDAETDKFFNERKAESFKTDKEYQDFLTQNKMTAVELKAAIKYQLTGQKLYEKVTSSISVNANEIKQYYDQNKDQFKEQVKVSHILIAAKTPEDFPKAKLKAEELITKLKNGADFKKLAKEYSEDPGSKDNGGFYDVAFSADDTNYVPEYVKGAFELKKVGDISAEPVKSSFGYHIMRLEAKIANDFKSQEANLKTQALQVKKNTFFQEYLDKLKKAAKIEENLKPVAPAPAAQQPSK
jgi:parvulin-like peptidyl-prolyl isomerase